MAFWEKKKKSPPASASREGRPVEDDTEKLLRTVRRVMAMIVVADGDVELSELEAFRAAYAKICGRELSLEAVKNEVRLTDGDTNVERFLVRMRDKMDVEDKQLILKAALAVANADGEVADSEDELLDRIVTALQLSDEEAKAALS